MRFSQYYFLIIFNFIRIFEAINNNNTSFLLDFISAKASLKNTVLENLCLKKDEKIKLQISLSKGNFQFNSINEERSDLFNYTVHQYQYIFLLHSDCISFEIILKKALKARLLTYPHIWIIFGNVTKLEEKNINIPLNGLVLIPSIKNLTTIYKINKKSDKYVRKRIKGNWSKSRNFFEFIKNIGIWNRTNLMKFSLTVMYVITDNSSFQHLEDYRSIHTDYFSKINYRIYELVFDLLNATQNKTYTDTWGFESRNGTHIFAPGMLEEILNENVDISGTVSFPSVFRLNYFKFLFPSLKNFGVFFAFRAPSVAYYTNLFSLPFEFKVWGGIGVVLLLGTILMRLIFYWEDCEEILHNAYEDDEREALTFLDVVIMQIGIACQMDVDTIPRSLSGKIALFSVLIFFTFIYTAFAAKIVLLLQLDTDKINDIESLYKAGYEFAVDDQPYHRYYFMVPSDRSDEHWRTIIYENGIKKHGNRNFITAEEGMRLLKDSYVAFNVDRSVAYYLAGKTFSDHEKCSLRLVDTIYRANVPYIIIRKDSPYIKLFLISFRRLVETGLYDREQNNYFAKKPQCLGRNNAFVSVGLIEAYFPLIIYLSGLGLSVLILIFEFLFHSHNLLK